MSRVNINEFIDRFHGIERTLNLFESTADDELWWDSVRFDACLFLLDCLTGLAYSSVHRPAPRIRKIGALRRWILREYLFARGMVRRSDLLVIRAARSTVGGRSQDMVLDPIVDLFRSRARTIDTIPRRYHLPDCVPSQWPGKVPPSLPDIVEALLATFGIDAGRAAQLEVLIRRGRSEYRCQVAGYHRLFAKLRPRLVLLAGVDKALVHVAKLRGIPTAEAQHGLIGHGHPAYSYPRGPDYTKQPGLPDLFLSFSNFWQANSHYPAGRKEVIGTDHFAADSAPMRQPLDKIMVISADIYHGELLELTREVASRLPNRQLVYKLHPNQAGDAAAIRAALADVPNVEVGDPLVPASCLMGEVSHLVAIQSTVVYEALQHGRRICIVPRHDYHIHSDILHLPEVAAPDTVEALVTALEIPSADPAGPTFFEKFDRERTIELLAPLLDAGPARAKLG